MSYDTLAALARMKDLKNNFTHGLAACAECPKLLHNQTNATKFNTPPSFRLS
jgi:hypothetical protein